MNLANANQQDKFHEFYRYFDNLSLIYSHNLHHRLKKFLENQQLRPMYTICHKFRNFWDHCHNNN